jgi:hypothetical protein
VILSMSGILQIWQRADFLSYLMGTDTWI